MKSYFKRILLISLVCILLLLTIMVVNTVRNSNEPVNTQSAAKAQVDPNLVAEHFSKALQIITISDPSHFNGQNFKMLHQLFEELYPRVHTDLRCENINEYSLLYTWEGTNPDLKPILLMGHIDGAPIGEGDDKKWTYAPFSGAIADGYVWGRGTMHGKLNVVTLLETVELLLKEEFKPTRTIYLAFGHDDDIVGDQGAAKIGQLLKSRGVKLEFVLEEGGMILDGIIEGVSSPVAQVAIAEKGYLSIMLSTVGQGGHSSIVPEKTAIGILAKAITNLEEYTFPAKISGASEKMFKVLSRRMPFSKKIILSNLWLTKPLVIAKFSKNDVSNALIRTTFATTVINGGVKDNVLPIQAHATANIRIIPGDTVESVMKTIKDTINDPRVEVKIRGHLAVDSQKMISSTDQLGYEMIETTINQLFPKVIVAPSQLTAITDAGNYKDLTENLYRFQPTWISSMSDARRVHGIDERSSLEDLERFVQFYVQLIKNAASPR